MVSPLRAVSGALLSLLCVSFSAGDRGKDSSELIAERDALETRHRPRTAITPYSRYRQWHERGSASRLSELPYSVMRRAFPSSGDNRVAAAGIPNIPQSAPILDSSVPITISLPPYHVIFPNQHQQTSFRPNLTVGSPAAPEATFAKAPARPILGHPQIKAQSSSIYSTASVLYPSRQLSSWKGPDTTIARPTTSSRTDDKISDQTPSLYEPRTGPKPYTENERPFRLPEPRRQSHILSSNTLQSLVPISAATNSLRSVPSVHYSRLAPAPAPAAAVLSPASSNIAESIFAQSQVRHAPPTLVGNEVTSAGDGIVSFLGSSNALENISKFARNLLTLPGPGQNELLSALTSALTGSKSAPLTSNAIVEATATPSSNIINAQEIFSSLAKEGSQAKDGKNATNDEAESFLKELPDEQRKLLAAAIQSGELDAESVHNAIGHLKTEVKSSSKEHEHRLLEWIQQNRPRAANVPDKVTVPSDKLPYYGKYCGSFSEQANSKKKFNTAGAVWAVDDRRFIISKFHFTPGSLLTENVTFWAGPNNVTGNTIADMFPSSNGFYLKPQPIDLTAFLSKEIKTIEAKERSAVKEPSIVILKGSGDDSAESNATHRVKRDLFSELYDRSRIDSFRDRFQEIPLPLFADDNSSQSVHLVVKGGLLTEEEGSAVDSNSTSSFENSSSEFTNATTEGILSSSGGSSVNADSLQSNDTVAFEKAVAMEPLEWYAGFQPFLLTLPDDKWMKTVYWLSVRDHKREETVASVLIPNGPAFQIPSIVQLRPLSSNGAFTISSGPIKVLDTKTVEISNFTLNSVPSSWFVVGKDILPNANGHIVPVYNKTGNTFDCDSLRNYSNETVTLRLPGSLDIKDVFWFSVFSLTQGVSLSHIYLPYNDMSLPPDLNGVATPRCVWKSP